MIKVDISNADAATAALLRDISALGNKAQQAAATAINATLAELLKISARLLQERYTVKTGDITRRASTQKASPKHLLGTLTFNGHRGWGLINFQARPAKPGPNRPKEGASVKVLRQGNRKTPRKFGQKAFAVTYKQSGNTHLAVRQGEKLVTLYGPHPLAALREAGAERELSYAAQDEFSKNLRAQLDKLLSRAGGQ